MSKKAIIISLLIVGVLVAAIPLTVYLVRQQQTVNSRAQVEEDAASGGQNASCQAPGSVENVLVEYPHCVQGDTLECAFDTASCSWDSVTGASEYNLKVTDIDTNTTVKSEKVTVSTTKITFPVVTGRTYQCDVSAINACGSTGGVGTDSLLCEIDGVFASPPPNPSPSPVPSPRVTPPPSPRPTPPPPSPLPIPTPSPIALGCGYTKCDQAGVTCGPGLVCVALANGQSACSNPAYEESCRNNPSVTSCCSAPKVPVKELPKGGDMDTTVVIGVVGVGLVILGGLILLF